MVSVDVVIPCYNYARFLPSCVRSVLSQRGVSVRVLIIDDCSTDDTSTVGVRLAAADARVEYRRHAVNLGHIATYNEGLLGWASADYCQLLSADDLLVPGALARATRVMEMEPDVGMVYGRVHEFTKEDRLPAEEAVWKGYSRWQGSRWLKDRFVAGHNVVATPTVVVRTAIQHQTGGYRPELPHAGDLEMWLRIAARSDVAYIKGAAQAWYRLHSSSMMNARFNTSLIDLHQRLEVYRSVVRHHRDSIEDADRLLEIGSRKLAREALGRACSGYDRNEVEQFGVRELELFAREAYPAMESLPEYRALLRRRFLGPKTCNRLQLFAFPRACRRLERMIWRSRWRSRGV